MRRSRDVRQSFQDGDPLHEQTLTQGEWFDVATYPHATFRSTSVRALGSNCFELAGTLAMKDRTLCLTPLTLAADGDRLTIDGKVIISRREANLGMGSDPDAQYVSDEISVEVRVLAEKR